MKTISIILCLMMALPSFARVRTENQLKFNLNSATLIRGDLQMYSKGKIKERRISREAHAILLGPGSEGTAEGQYMVIRAAGVIDQPISFFQNPELAVVANIEKLLPGVTVVRELENGGVRISKTASGMTIETNVNWEHLTSPEAIEASDLNELDVTLDFASLKTADAVMYKEFTKFSRIFGYTAMMNRFYDYNGKTLVVSDQIIKVKQSSLDSLGFLSGLVWGRIKTQIGTELEAFQTQMAQ